MRQATDLPSLYRRLAVEAFENGDHCKCVAFAQKLGDPIPQDLREMVRDSAYKCGLRLTANGNLHGARKMLGCALTLDGPLSLRRPRNVSSIVRQLKPGISV